MDARFLVSQGCIKPLCDLLVCPDPRITIVCMEGLENILKVGEAEKANTGGYNDYAQLIDDADGVEKLDNLQCHNIIEIDEMAVKILEHWLEDDENENVPAGDETLTGFSFGGNDIHVPAGGFEFG